MSSLRTHQSSERASRQAPTHLWHLFLPAVGLAVGAVVGTEPLLGFAALCVALLGMVILRRPDWATLVAVAVLYSNAAVVAYRIHGLPKIASQAAMLLILIALAHHLAIRRRQVLLPAAYPWLVAFLLVQLVGAARASDPLTALEAVQDFITSGFLVYLAFANAIRTEGVLRKAIWTLLLVGAVLGSLSLHQSVTGNFDDDYLGFAQISEGAMERQATDTAHDAPAPRLAGPIGEQNYYNQIMFTLAAAGALVATGHPRRVARFSALCLTALVAVGGSLTFSRGGMAGLALALVVLAVLRYVRLRHLVLVALGLVVLLFSFPQYLERIESIGSAASVASRDSATDEVDAATLGRMGASMAALRVFADHPVVGVGPDMFSSHYREQALETNFNVHEGGRGAHNLYLGILAEYGSLGMLALSGAVWVTLRDLARARRRLLASRPELAAIATALFGGLVTYLATGIFLSLAYQRYFWFLLAISAATIAISSDSPEEAPPVHWERGSWLSSGTRAQL